MNSNENLKRMQHNIDDGCNSFKKIFSPWAIYSANQSNFSFPVLFSFCILRKLDSKLIEIIGTYYFHIIYEKPSSKQGLWEIISLTISTHLQQELMISGLKTDSMPEFSFLGVSQVDLLELSLHDFWTTFFKNLQIKIQVVCNFKNFAIGVCRVGLRLLVWLFGDGQLLDSEIDYLSKLYQQLNHRRKAYE